MSRELLTFHDICRKLVVIKWTDIICNLMFKHSKGKERGVRKTEIVKNLFYV